MNIGLNICLNNSIFAVFVHGAAHTVDASWRYFSFKEPLIKSGFNQLDAKKWEDHFLEAPKNAHSTGEINSPYSRFLGLLLCKSPQEALNQCFLKQALIKAGLRFSLSSWWF